MAAHGVHQRRAQLEQAGGRKLLVAGVLGVVGGPAQQLQAGVHRAGGERRLAGLQQRAGHRAAGHAGRRFRQASPRRAAQRRRRLGAELAAEQLLGLIDVLRCGVVRPGGHQALDQQHVRALVVHVALHPERGELHGVRRVAGRQGAQHRAADLGVDQPGDALGG